MSKPTELESLRRLRGTAKGKLSRKCKLLREQVSENSSWDQIESYYMEVQKAFSELEILHGKVTENMCQSVEENFDKKLEEEELYIEQAEIIKNEAYAQLMASRKKVEEECATEKLKIKVKPLDPPKFDGDIRQYQTFRSNYRKIMTETYGKNAYALFQCLSGEALSVVHGVEDDFDKMFYRLDQRYADPIRLTDCIIEQLRKLKPIPEGDTIKFIDAVNVIENCWTDMQRNQLKEQMSTVIVISLIEKILPSQQRRDWTRIYQDLTDKSSAFPNLMEFLLKERQILDYMDKDVRKFSQPNKASVHNVEVSERDDPFISALQKLQIQQTEHQANIENILQRMTQFITGNPKVTQSRFPLGNSIYCWYHNSDNHSIHKCSVFHNLEPTVKMDVLKKNFICFHCLGKGHSQKNCHERRTCFIKMKHGNVCGKPHHPKLHYLFSQINPNEVNININKSENSILLMIGQVHCKDREIVTLFDPGSTNSLITHSKARELGLCGIPYNITMVTVGNVCDTVSTKLYEVPLIDVTGKIRSVHCVGIDDITSEVKPVDISEIHYIFDVSTNTDILRPQGKVDLLIGADNCDMIPSVVKTVGKLQLMKGPFGYCIRGSHQNFKDNNTRYYSAKINHIQINRELDALHGEPWKTLKEDLDNFFTVDHLGTNCKLQCDNCSNCNKCSRELDITIKEEEEMKLILKGLNHQEREKVWVAHYPWIKDPYLLPNNFAATIMRLKGTERRLRKLGEMSSKAYKEQIDDMLKRGVAKKLTKDEIRHYSGPVHYVSHHEILKPDSISTPTRIVFNSSASYNGHILNHYWAKGPNVLNNLFGLLLRFRENPIAFIGDISKMFNSIRLSEFDCHVHRFLWRGLEDRPPDHYALTAVPFGNICSPAIAVLVMRQTAYKYKERFPKAAIVIIGDSYMDDIIHSADNIDDAIECMNDIEYILKQGSFHIKKWVMNGNPHTENDINLLNTEGEKVLGIMWNPERDEMWFKTNLRFMPKRESKISCVTVRLETLDKEFPEILTKRQVLSQIATIFDPMGYAAPIILCGKLLMREVIVYLDEMGKKLDWDDPLPRNLREKWYIFFKSIFQLENLCIPRCIRNTSLIEPSLIIFSDASTQAYSACAYARWQVDRGNYESRLLASKSRLAPVKQQTIPKLELSSAVLGVRLRNAIIKESSIQYHKVYHLTDSEIILAQIMKPNISVGTYVANRISEIKETTSNEEWHWIPTDSNVADLLTRPDPTIDISSESKWQKGPPFLKLPYSQWPVKSIPLKSEETVISNTIEINSLDTETTLFDIEGFQSYRKLIYVTARIINAFRQCSFKAIKDLPTIEELNAAETIWIKRIQAPLLLNWKRRFKRLGPFMKNDTLYVGARIAIWMKNNYNNESFILLPTKHKFTELCIKEFHDRDHAGIETTLCKLQNKFWIPQARRLIRRIKSQCVTCRKLERRIIGQSMGPVPKERLKPSPPFYHAALDLFGPLLIKDTVKGRCKKKVYGVMINCLSSRASYVDLIEGYDADSFITTLRRFTALRGFPRSIYSDCGTQLKLASKELTQFGLNGGMEWNFTKSADAPWENGCSEALVKLVKKTIARVIGNATLTFGELQTVMFEIANILNERPIGMKNGSSAVQGSYLCPNDLILGRASVKAPEGIFTHNVSTKSRQNFINDIVKSFWKKWMIHYFPTLIIQQKWHCEKRNLRVGDVVIVQDQNTIKGTWKLAEVCSIIPSSDGKVRDVEIRYKIQKENGDYEGQQDVRVNRSVHKLVLILPVEDQ